MKDHFSAGRKNAQYHSPKIQNDLIAAVGKWIQQKLTQEIKAAKFFTVCANEGTDVANKEQLTLIIRFVDQSGMIREEFLEFVLSDTGTSGQAVADKSNSLWKSLHLTSTTFEDKDMMEQATCLVSTGGCSHHST